jgi:hypothetical protein
LQSLTGYDTIPSMRVVLDTDVVVASITSPVAAAEKLAAIQTAETFFAQRRERGDVDKALAFLSRQGGETPRSGDEC